VNNVPHIGHIVGCHLPADIFARFQRLFGNECIFIGGTDEHGTPSEVQAQKLGITPKELCDKLYQVHKKVYDWFNLSYDNFTRTSKPLHHEITRKFFLKIYENGYVEEREVELPFCPKCERVLPDRYVTGTCPYCGYEGARGDQCEHCTKLLSPNELVDPKCVICSSSPVFKKFKHLFLRLDKLEGKIREWIESQEHWSLPVKNAALGWLKEGLKPRSITRDLKWGVKVPLKGWEDKVFYVWFDAPIGYITGAKELGKEDFWKGEARIYHFIGKDNIPFHTVWWGGMLIANGEYSLPYQVVGLQYLNYEGRKISKSKKWGVFCEKLPKTDIPPDVWRFYLAHLIPETRDSEWKWEEFKEKVNKELVGNVGNFINRVVSFTHSNFGGRLEKTELDEGVIERCDELVDRIREEIEKVHIRKALKLCLEISDLGNKYFQEKKPWETKDKKVIYTCANIVKKLAICLWPFLPESMEKVANAFGFELKWEEVKRELGGKSIKKLPPLFPQLKDIERLKEVVTKPTPLEDYFQISIDEFRKADLRVGEVLKAEHIPDTRLLKLEVDLGELGKRQIIAGIGDKYKAEEMIGKKIIVVVNLKPKVIRGFKSEGMLLATEEKVLLTPEGEVRNGSKVL